MDTDAKPLTVAQLIVSAAELPFCRSTEDDDGWNFPCGLEVGDSPFVAEGSTANSVSDTARFVHAKHHIDGHIPLYGKWTFVACIVALYDDEPDYRLSCSCDEELMLK